MGNRNTIWKLKNVQRACSSKTMINHTISVCLREGFVPYLPQRKLPSEADKLSKTNCDMVLYLCPQVALCILAMELNGGKIMNCEKAFPLYIQKTLTSEYKSLHAFLLV